MGSLDSKGPGSRIDSRPLGSGRVGDPTIELDYVYVWLELRYNESAAARCYYIRTELLLRRWRGRDSSSSLESSSFKLFLFCPA